MKKSMSIPGCFVLGIVFTASGGLFADVVSSTWKNSVGSGEWAVDVNWSKTRWPSAVDTAAYFAGNSDHSPVDCTVYLPDETNKINYLHVLHRYPSSFTLDGRGRVFSIGALDEGENKRGLQDVTGASFYPFRIMSESGSSSEVLQLSRASADGHLEAVFDWRDALLRTSSPAPKDVTVEFLGGTFDFNVDNLKKWHLSFAGTPLSKASMTVSNATVRCTSFTSLMAATNSSLIVDGGSLITAGNFSYGHNVTYDYPGTNRLEVKNGGKIAVDNGGEKRNNYELFVGSAASHVRRTEISVTGPGSSLDFSQASQMYVQGNYSIALSDGAVVKAPGTIGLAQNAVTAAEPALGELSISGEDTVLYISTNLSSGAVSTSGILQLGNVDNSSNRVVVTGGSILPLYPSGTGAVAMRLSSASSAYSLFDMRGGFVDIWVTNSPNTVSANNIRLGPGDSEFRVSGGKVHCGDFYVGSGQSANATEGTESHVVKLHMTGGEVTCSRLYIGSSNNDQSYRYQDVRVILDGGVLRVNEAFVHNPSYSGGYSDAKFSADGGTLRVQANSDIMRGFTTAVLGPRGLTLDPNDCTAVTLTQSFSDKPGEKGLLRFSGEGIVIFAPDRYHSVATTEVERTTLMFKTNTTLSTTLVVKDGACVSLVNAVDEITLDALVGEGGTLLVDPGDVVRIKNPVLDIDGMTVKFQSQPTVGEACGVFAFDGNVTSNAAVCAALRRLTVSNAPSGYYGQFETLYDEATGKTTVTMTYEPDESEPLGDDVTVWNGPSWNDEGWSAGVPAKGSVAAFTKAESPAAVAVPAFVQLGALRFSSGLSHVLSGGETLFEITGRKGESFIEVASGDQTLDLPVALRHETPVTVAEGASLAFNREIVDGGIVKTGKGVLTLAAENDFAGEVSLGGGLNVAADAGALGCNGAVLTEDTLVFTNSADGSEMEVTSSLTLDSVHSLSNALVVKTDSDVVIDSFKVAAGSFIKRGAAKMTIEVDPDDPPTFSGGMGVGKGANFTLTSGTEPVEFAADGSAPGISGNNFAGFNVAEGELVIRGVPQGDPFWIKSALAIGIEVAGDQAGYVQPELTVDGAWIGHNGGGGHWYIGHHLAKSGNAVARPTLRIVNGGKVSCSTLRIGENSNNSPGAFSTIALTNSTLTAVNGIRFFTAGGTLQTACMYVRAKDSTFAVSSTGGGHHGIYPLGNFDGEFDNTFFGGSNMAGVLTLSNASNGEMRFCNGSVFSISNLCHSGKDSNGIFKFVFDDAEWRWGDGDYVFRRLESPTAGFGLRENRSVELRGTGLVLKPGAGRTFTTEIEFEGDGGLVCDGAGTVAFRGGALQFSGLVDIRSGTVDLTQSDALDSLSVRGPGTLKGGNIGELTIKVSLAADGVPDAPVLDGTTAESVTLDFGCDTDSPLDLSACNDVLVAKLSGAAVPEAGKWTVTGIGHASVIKEFLVRDGEIRLTVRERKPLSIIVR